VIPLPVVYGCYTDGEAVRLVLNVEQLAVHYHQSGTAVLLPTFTGMARKNQADSRTAFDLKVAAPVAAVAAAATAAEPVLPQPAPPPDTATVAPAPLPETATVAPAAAPETPPEPAPLAVSPVAYPSAFSTLSAQVEIVTSPAEPGPTPDLFVPTQATPHIGDEDLLEPALALGLSEMSIPVRPGSGGLRQGETLTASASKQDSPAQGRTIRRALYAAAIVILLAAGVIAGLLPGAHRPGSAAPVAKEPEIATNTIPSNTAPTEYVVKTGDTLWDIAAQFTGDAHNYSGIAGYNGITDPNLISPGQVLRLPPDFNKKPGAPTP
jgi:nucleoid-associated protein YgaU